METKTIFEALSAPMPFKWRLKTVTNKAKRPYPEGTRGQFLAYIDARDVFNRLDGVLGLPHWQSEIRQVNEDGSVLARLSIKVGDQWIVREDIGYPNDPTAGVETEPLKAAASDAIKRAAVHFGIGRFLYELPAQWVEIDSDGRPMRPLTGAHETVDQSTGEIHGTLTQTRQSAPHGPEREPDRADAAGLTENRPCAIEGCAGVCNGSWVGFSIKRYGVPLCSKHSAQGKRGELDAELDRLNAAQAAR